MASLKKLLSNTMIYGLSTIVGRSINFLLVPFQTGILTKTDFGILSGMYAYVAFLNVVYVFGMETTYFRQVKDLGEKRSFNGTLSIVILISGLMSIIIFGFTSQFAHLIDYPEQTRIIRLLGYIMLIDALVALPFARLRQLNQAKKFALTRLTNIALVVILNLFFLIYLPEHKNDNIFFEAIYKTNYELEYVVWANLLANCIFLPLFFKNLSDFKFEFEISILKKLSLFASPLVIAGLSGMVNELFDRRLLKTLTPIGFYDYAENNDVVVGVYSACYKLTLFISLANQAFRYAAEPFFFGKAEDKNAPETFVIVMKYYIIFMCVAVVGISLLRDELGLIFIRNSTLREGLYIVPILLFANVFLGIYYNQSIWYKITDKTKYGLLISIIGAAITISLNYLLIPIIGYLGSAITTLSCYLSMVICSHYWGQKFFPVPYNMKNGLFHLIMALGIVCLSYYIQVEGFWQNVLYKAAVVILYLGGILFAERSYIKSLLRKR